MNSDFFSVASSGLGDNKRNIKCMITDAVVASYANNQDTAAAWATARAAQAATITTLQNGGYIQRKASYYNLSELRDGYERSQA